MAVNQIMFVNKLLLVSRKVIILFTWSGVVVDGKLSSSSESSSPDDSLPFNAIKIKINNLNNNIFYWLIIKHTVFEIIEISTVLLCFISR